MMIPSKTTSKNANLNIIHWTDVVLLTLCQIEGKVLASRKRVTRLRLARMDCT
jgi:hypothetical protein